jgi:hypothetical protein
MSTHTVNSSPGSKENRRGKTILDTNTNFSGEFALFKVNATARTDVRREHACLVVYEDILMNEGREIRQGQNSTGTYEKTPPRHSNKLLRFDNQSLRALIAYLLTHEENIQGLLTTAGG